jgi:hypothetical protein
LGKSTAVEDVLTALNCMNLWPKFKEEEINTLEALQNLSLDNLNELGCKMGSRNKILNWQKEVR